MRSARLANLADDRFKGTLLPQLLEPLGFQWADTESATKLDLLMDYREQKRLRREVLITAFVLLLMGALVALYRLF